jgi:hypothetical protein
MSRLMRLRLLLCSALSRFCLPRSALPLNFNGGPFPWVNGLLGGNRHAGQQRFQRRSLSQLGATQPATAASIARLGAAALNLVAFRIGAMTSVLARAPQHHRADYVPWSPICWRAQPELSCWPAPRR